jgi:hypothetical protein
VLERITVLSELELELKLELELETSASCWAANSFEAMGTMIGSESSVREIDVAY